MSNKINFNQLWIIESLPENDLKTGTHLFNNHLKNLTSVYPDLKIIFEQPYSKIEFIDLLKKIRDDAQSNGNFPMIHFECHGCKDGLGTANNEFLAWDDLRQILIEINQACKLNLVITLAACNGAYLIKVVTKLDKAPFSAIIGSEKELFDVDIQKDFASFYSKFFEELNGDKAILELNRGVTDSTREYRFISADTIFLNAYKNYYNSHCIGDGLNQRIETLVTQALGNDDIKIRGKEWVRKMVVETLENDKEKHFQKQKINFFLIDIYPDNDLRFPYSYSDIVKKCES